MPVVSQKKKSFLVSWKSRPIKKPLVHSSRKDGSFDNELSLATTKKELADPESETYFVVKDGEIAVFSLTGDRAPGWSTNSQFFTIPGSKNLCVEAYHGLVTWGKEMFEFASEEAEKRGLTGSG